MRISCIDSSATVALLYSMHGELLYVRRKLIVAIVTIVYYYYS